MVSQICFQRVNFKFMLDYMCLGLVVLTNMISSAISKMCAGNGLIFGPFCQKKIIQQGVRGVFYI